MLRWLPYACVRITFFFIAGILLGVYVRPFSYFLAISAAIVTTFLYLVIFAIFRKSIYSKNLFISIAGFTAIFFLGVGNVVIHTDTLKENHIVNVEDTITYFTAEVVRPAEEKDKTNQYLLRLKAFQASNRWYQGDAKLFLYIGKEEKITYGDLLLIKGQPYAIESPRNPGEFDYKRFLSFKNITHQVFIKPNDYKLISRHHGWLMLEQAYAFRAGAVNVFDKYLENDETKAIAMALILGVKDRLADEMQQAYAASGAMHVLAVSGLHVGVIYAILLFLLKVLNKVRYGRWIQAVISLVVLWCYAMITGFSPSVLRAVTMFSFIVLAKASNRQTNIYNTLAASALILLIFDPYLIMSVGFQLSFLAVMGIVYVQPKIYNWFVPSSVIVDRVWGITSVALAAQLATFPLSLLYFHQFPSYFFLSNLVVIPGALLTLCSGLLLLAVSWVDVLAQAVAIAMDGIINLMNYAVFAFEKLPFAQISDVYINLLEVWLIIGIIISWLLYFQLLKLRLIYLGVSLALIFAFYRIVNVYISVSNEIIFYNVPNHTAIDFISEGKSLIYTDQSLSKDRDKIHFHIQPKHLRKFVSDVYNVKSNDNAYRKVNAGHLFTFEGKTIWLLDTTFVYELNARVKVNYLVLAGDNKFHLSKMNDFLHFDQLIFDASIPKWRLQLLKQEADELHLPYYALAEKGALIIKPE